MTRREPGLYIDVVGAALYGVSRQRGAPRCAVCRKTVDVFEETHDAFMGRVVFVAKCHGESERVVLTEAETRGLTFGEAFTTAARRLSP